MFALAWPPDTNLGVPSDARQVRRLRNSLRSNNPRRPSVLGFSSRPRQKAMKSVESRE